jgi:hypothetical protein
MGTVAGPQTHKCFLCKDLHPFNPIAVDHNGGTVQVNRPIKSNVYGMVLRSEELRIFRGTLGSSGPGSEGHRFGVVN